MQIACLKLMLHFMMKRCELMQELELTKSILEELKYIEELQQNVKESESDDITGHMGGSYTLLCC